MGHSWGGTVGLAVQRWLEQKKRIIRQKGGWLGPKGPFNYFLVCPRTHSAAVDALDDFRSSTFISASPRDHTLVPSSQRGSQERVGEPCPEQRTRQAQAGQAAPHGDTAAGAFLREGIRNNTDCRVGYQHPGETSFWENPCVLVAWSQAGVKGSQLL